MITIRIGESVRSLEDDKSLDESWINQQINRRRADNQPVCVQISIKENPLNMALSSSGCPSRGGGRPPNQHEQQIFDLWEKVGMSKSEFHGGNLVAFLKQLSSLI
ncbi:MAG: hypothetical protein M0R70_04625 [Nitrospirae bacterium]|nr:hypothetical protein [Nitrospirota bacterium]